MQSGGSSEASQGVRDVDLSPGQPLQPSQSSASLGVIGRRSAPDLGAIADNINVANPGVLHDHAYNLQMLESSYYKLPHSKDSERVKNYIPVSFSCLFHLCLGCNDDGEIEEETLKIEEKKPEEIELRKT